jgi:amino acid adenylation domain-containing protein
MPQRAIDGFRLSPQQARLWLILHADSEAAYRADGVITIEGDLDGEILALAVTDVLRRHEIFRTTFRRLPGMRFPLQVISPPGVEELHRYDLSAVDAEQQQAELDRIRAAASELPFELEQGPLFHLALARLSSQRHVLLMQLSSLCADAATLRNLAREISGCYSARTTGGEDPDEPLQYPDCAEWLNELQEATGGPMADGAAYWRGQNLQALSVSRLSSHERSLPEERFSVGRLTLDLPVDVPDAVARCAAECGSSVPMFLLACWQVLLARLNGQTQLVVGCVHDGRVQDQLHSALGLFARHVPLRCDLPEHLSFRDVLEQVGGSYREACQWQDAFSWENIARQSGEASDPAFIPVCFEFEEQANPQAVAGVTFSLIDHQSCIDRFEVKLRAVQRGSGLRIELHYDTELFSEDEMDRLGERFATVVSAAAGCPDATVGHLEVIGHAERRKVLFDLNPAGAQEFSRSTVHRLFEQQAGQTPDRIAVVCAGQRLTYAELNGRANELAHQLRRFGLGADVPVGLFLPRSLDLAVGVLGVLKAGGAWLPLDPNYPKDRLALLLADAQVPVLVTRQALARDLPQQRAATITLDADWSSIPLPDIDDTQAEPERSNLAYMVYTSGSTGVPKGVMVTHANLSDYVQAIGKPLRLTPDDVYLHTASFGFSSAVRQLLVPLTHGAKVVIATSDEIREPVRLFQTVQSEGVTIIDLVPSYWRACTDALGQLAPATRQAVLANRLRLILSASEPLPGDLPRQWKVPLGNKAEMINMFGLTETTGIVAIHRIQPNDEAAARVVPIGRPIDHTRIHILDSWHRPVPIGTIGEIYVAGAGVSRGYLNQPALTAAAFLPYPFGDQPGSRMCRTGDRGRYLPDGSIEILARMDQQLKIRGFRVEPGEIESVLRRHPGVAAAVVVGREIEQGERRIVAYVVPRAPYPEVAELSQLVKDRLPGYMVPSAFVLLDALPLTPTGKVDRMALPQVGSHLSQHPEVSIAPRTPTEEVLAGIWAEVLGLDRVGIHDDVFALGGHSLMVTQAVSRIRRALAVEVPVEMVFDSPTVAELGIAIDHFADQAGTP